MRIRTALWLLLSGCMPAAAPNCNGEDNNGCPRDVVTNALPTGESCTGPVECWYETEDGPVGCTCDRLKWYCHLPDLAIHPARRPGPPDAASDGAASDGAVND